LGNRLLASLTVSSAYDIGAMRAIDNGGAQQRSARRFTPESPWTLARCLSSRKQKYCKACCNRSR